MRSIIFLIFVFYIIYTVFIKSDNDEVQKEEIKKEVQVKKETKPVVKEEPKPIVKQEKVDKPKPVVKKPYVQPKLSYFSGSVEGDSLGTINRTKYNYPTNIAVYNKSLYIVDEANQKVKVVSNNKVKEIIFHEQNKFTKKNKPISIKKISSIVVNKNNIIVADYWSSQIYKFSKEGTFISRYKSSSSNKLNKPLDIAEHNGDIYIADTHNNKIKLLADNKIMPYSGKEKYGNLDGSVDIATFSKPSKILSYKNKLYVLDSGRNKVRIISNNSVKSLKIKAKTFCVKGDILYYYDIDKKAIYQYSLSSGKNKKIIEDKKIDALYDMDIYNNNNIIITIPEKHLIYQVKI
ncbi:MAG: hypothetical protein U9O56_06950 [Campylobacterota bacterium]|nr:hypothetical protein [Campylobacterota bacterium]